jgi:LysM repeat protein
LPDCPLPLVLQGPGCSIAAKLSRPGILPASCRREGTRPRRPRRIPNRGIKKMQRDLKIGLFSGLVLVIAAVLWLATRPSLSPRARMSNTPNAATARESFASPNDLATNETNIDDVPPVEGLLSVEGAAPSNRGQAGLEQSRGDTPGTLTNSAQYEQTEKIKTQKFHIVRKDQTLSSIAQKYYGSAGKWKKIFDYNRSTIKDPNKLIPGTKLIIPD